MHSLTEHASRFIKAVNFNHALHLIRAFAECAFQIKRIGSVAHVLESLRIKIGQSGSGHV